MLVKMSGSRGRRATTGDAYLRNAETSGTIAIGQLIVKIVVVA